MAKTKFIQGYFTPRNPEKYIGKNKQIVYRSSWEKSVMNYLDTDSKIVGWCSECVVVPYTFQGKNHRYYTDFLAIDDTGKRIIVEVKPLKQTKPPRNSKNKSKKTIMTESYTYYKNLAKWEAAQKYCKKRGWEFRVITEKNLKI